MFLTLISFQVLALPKHGDHNQKNISIYNKEIVLEKRDVFPFFYPLIKSLRKRGFPIKFIIKTLQLVDRVEFVDFDDQEITGLYKKMGNKVQLESTFINPRNGKLKALNELKLIHVTTLYHELWHAYFFKYVKAKRPLFYYLYQEQMLKTFAGDIHAQIIQNEAYGVFVALAIQNYYQHYTILNYIGREGRQRLYAGKKLEQMVSRYQEVLNYPVFGYHFDILQRGLTDDDRNLPKKDRRLIFEHVFQNEISQDFLKNFPEKTFNVEDSQS